MDFFKFDPTKIDRVALKKWLIDGGKLLEPAVITPGNLDKMLFDNLDWIVDNLISQISNESAPGGGIEVGASFEDAVFGLKNGDEVSEVEMTTYLSKFSNVPEQSRKLLKDNPKLLRRIQKFTPEQQEKIVGNPLLILALQTLLPLLFELFFKKFING